MYVFAVRGPGRPKATETEEAANDVATDAMTDKTVMVFNYVGEGALLPKKEESETGVLLVGFMQGGTRRPGAAEGGREGSDK